MTDQRAIARRISSFAAPTEEEITLFESLAPAQQLALLRAEIDKGFTSDVSDRSLDQIIADARARAQARRANNG
jgi:hypothetical protein